MSETINAGDPMTPPLRDDERAHETTTAEPLPCPFCGAPNPARHPNDLTTNGSCVGVPKSDAFYVHCDECGAEGPVGDDEPESVANWNARALTSEVSRLSTALAEARPAISDVIAERARQDAQWGGPEHDDTHTPSDWRSYRNRFEGRAAEAFGKRHADHRACLVKIAALAVAQIESFDRLRAASPSTEVRHADD